MASSWKDLPIETLYSILDLLPPRFSRNTTSECRRVCKSWETAAEFHLYSTLNIETEERLERFNNAILGNNSRVAALIKRVNLNFELSRKDDKGGQLVYTLLSNLPNLQHFHSFRSECYVEIADAILEGKLLKLKAMNYTDNCSNPKDYIICALLLKDRLENLFIFGDKPDKFRRLSDRLHQFKQLDRLSLEKTSVEPIEDVELILSKCPTLTELKANFDLERSTSPVEGRAIPLSCSPRINMSSLDISFRELTTDHIEHIMHRFPNLNTLRLRGERVLFNRSLLERFLTYLLKVRYINIKRIIADPRFACDCIGNYWKAASAKNPTQLETAIFTWSPFSSFDFKLKKEGNSKRKTSIHGSPSNPGFAEVVKDYGVFIGAMEIKYFGRHKTSQGHYERADLLLESVYSLLLMNVWNLKKLRFSNCDVNYGKNLRTLEGVTEREFTLQKLEFLFCSVGVNTLHSLFGGVRYIEHLSIANCTFADFKGRECLRLGIYLPQTKVKNVSLKHSGYSLPNIQKLFVRISKIVDEATSLRQKSYYMYDFDSMDNKVFRKIDKKQFNKRKYHAQYHFSLCCRTLISPLIDFNAEQIRFPSD